MGRTACIVHHILVKKEYSDLIIKLKESGEGVNAGGLISHLASLPWDACSGREGSILVPPGKGRGGRRSSRPSSSGLGERNMFVCQRSNPFSVGEKLIWHSAPGSFAGLYPVTVLALS